ncbi:MAG: dipeptidase [Mycobacterium leprae]
MTANLEAYFQERRDRYIAELVEFLRIPSISSIPSHEPHMREAAAFVVRLLQQAGVDRVESFETGGAPIVYAEWQGAPGAYTVLIYGHYDVQPPDPLDRWESPPFEPSFRDERIYARGVSDDKGPLFQAIKAVEALHAVRGSAPVNIKFLIEGEEEVSSRHLAAFVQEKADLLAADLVISADGAMWRTDEPSVTYACRGGCSLQIDLTTASIPLHSGRFGGAIPNAALALAEILAGLHDAHGAVAVEGFYDHVLPVAPDEQAALLALPFRDDEFQASLGLAGLAGEEGFTTLERLWTRPTLEVTGMWGGYIGEGSQGIVPAESHAKISCRLVANQQPEQVLDAIERHIMTHLPPGVRVQISRGGGSVPYVMPRDLPALKVAAEVLTETMGKEAALVRMGASEPAAILFEKALGAYTLFYSFSTADEQFHAPNEFFRLERFDTGLRAWSRLLERLGE